MMWPRASSLLYLHFLLLLLTLGLAAGQGHGRLLLHQQGPLRLHGVQPGLAGQLRHPTLGPQLELLEPAQETDSMSVLMQLT